MAGRICLKSWTRGCATSGPTLLCLVPFIDRERERASERARERARERESEEAREGERERHSKQGSLRDRAFRNVSRCACYLATFCPVKIRLTWPKKGLLYVSMVLLVGNQGGLSRFGRESILMMRSRCHLIILVVQ